MLGLVQKKLPKPLNLLSDLYTHKNRPSMSFLFGTYRWVVLFLEL